MTDGVLFFIHGAAETSEGLVANLSRIEDQVRRARLGRPGRRAGVASAVRPAARELEEGALPRPPAATDAAAEPPRRVPARDAVLKIVTNYFEDRRESLIDADRRADAGRRHRLPAPSRLDPGGPQGRADAGPPRRPAADRSCPSALSLGGIALVDLLASWPEAPVEACVTVGSQAPLLYTFDAIPSMPYDEANPPYLPVPWLNVYDSRDFLSFVAEPLFRRRTGWRAWSTCA